MAVIGPFKFLQVLMTRMSSRYGQRKRGGIGPPHSRFSNLKHITLEAKTMSPPYIKRLHCASMPTADAGIGLDKMTTSSPLSSAMSPMTSSSTPLIWLSMTTSSSALPFWLRVPTAKCSTLEGHLRCHHLNWPRICNIPCVPCDDIHLSPVATNRLRRRQPRGRRKGLNFVISEAGKNGVRLILSLVNNWNDYGGKKKYVEWARERGQNLNNDDDFYTNPVVKQYYKNHVNTVLTRKNTITGILYKDDQTIFAWELMNEPRCQSDPSGISLQNWVREMAAYVKSTDKKHLLQAGLEGFYGKSTQKRILEVSWPVQRILPLLDHPRYNTTKVRVAKSGYTQPYYINGFNAYWLLNLASNPSTSSKVTTAFQQASQYGLNVARTWAFNDGVLQISPGSYNENVFRGLDFVISEARKYGVKLILALTNNWIDFGGKSKYVQWAKERDQRINNDDEFYTNSVTKQYYKNYVKTVLTRKNTITGILYKDDPTIFAWELMNEPRCPADPSGRWLQSWVSEMAAYVKSIDNRHLLQVGLEGFYGKSMQQKNPGGVLIGTDFIANNKVPEIDFTTIHLYPEAWLPKASEKAQDLYGNTWVTEHIQDSNNILRKPMLLAEFGKSARFPGFNVRKRDFYFQKIYNFIYYSSKRRGPLVGGLYWQLMAPGMNGYGDGYEIIFQDSPSTANVIAQQSHRIYDARIHFSSTVPNLGHHLPHFDFHHFLTFSTFHNLPQFT
ncbi:hypothetical protein Fmac_006876 [Flemingia macrophylla]|uniref:mannan endo-1,4-beta-mannosidase n=1 Tax=Flemingia macrophylla TaxID=520843 RepID=A0ABD1NBV4_9FABA